MSGGGRAHDLANDVPSVLFRFGCDCVEHVLDASSPPVCLQILGAKRAGLRGEPGAEDALKVLGHEAWEVRQTERAGWRMSGVLALAVEAAIALVWTEPLMTAQEAAERAANVVSQRAHHHCAAASSRERGDAADVARAREVEWQAARLAQLRAGVPE